MRARIAKGRKTISATRKRLPRAVQRPTMKFVATKTADQLDLQALHRVRERLVRQRTGIRYVRSCWNAGLQCARGFRFLRTELPGILGKRSDVLSPHMMRLIEDLAEDSRRLDEGIEGLSTDITSLVEQDPACERLMTVLGIPPIISSHEGNWTARSVVTVISGSAATSIWQPGTASFRSWQTSCCRP